MDNFDKNFKFEDLKQIHVGDIPSAKKGIIDNMLGEEEYKETVPDKFFNSYLKGQQIGSYVKNILKCDERKV